MKLDPIRKKQILSEITEYINLNYSYVDYGGYNNSEPYDSLNESEINDLLNYCDIENVSFKNIYHPLRSNFFYQNNIDDESLQKLYNYIKNINVSDLNGWNGFFYSKYTVDILKSNKKYKDLNFYLEECYKCSLSNHKLASIILLRCLVEIFLTLSGYNKNNNLSNAITNFILDAQNPIFDIFNKNNKKNELEIFFTNIRKLGNDVAHFKKEDVESSIDNIDNEALLRLFCVLIEHSILQEDIKEKEREEILLKIQAIDFRKKEKIQNIKKEEDQNLTEENDDEIPF